MKNSINVDKEILYNSDVSMLILLLIDLGIQVVMISLLNHCEWKTSGSFSKVIFKEVPLAGKKLIEPKSISAKFVLRPVPVNFVYDSFKDHK